MDTDTDSESTFSDILTDILEPEPHLAPKEQDVDCSCYLKGVLLDQEEEFIEKAGSIQRSGKKYSSLLQLITLYTIRFSVMGLETSSGLRSEMASSG